MSPCSSRTDCARSVRLACERRRGAQDQDRTRHVRDASEQLASDGRPTLQLRDVATRERVLLRNAEHDGGRAAGHVGVRGHAAGGYAVASLEREDHERCRNRVRERDCIAVVLLSKCPCPVRSAIAGCLSGLQKRSTRLVVGNTAGQVRVGGKWPDGKRRTSASRRLRRRRPSRRDECSGHGLVCC